MTATEKPKNYEECLTEIRALRADPDYDNLASKRRKNTGPEITPEIFKMSSDEMQGLADKIDRLDFSQCRQ